MAHPHLWQSAHYQLIDFGNGRKLERFGAVVLDRPCPAAEHKRTGEPPAWEQADLRVDPSEQWQHVSRTQRDEWHVAFDRVTFALRLTPFGHVGLFPEHAQNWRWLTERARDEGSPPLRVLNLFGYTGGASLLLAAHGWEVVHVDSSAPSVAWARHNAQLSGLDAAPIRWIVDDARSFASREVRRGRLYDAIVMDPPSYGHGPKGRAWQIQRDLRPLLSDCVRLLQPDRGALVVTGHSDAIDGESLDLPSVYYECEGRKARVETGRLSLGDRSERTLDCGWYARAIASN